MDDEDINEYFDLGTEEDDQPISIQLPPQLSANDTSNQDGKVIIAPDGKEHIKELSSEDGTKKS